MIPINTDIYSFGLPILLYNYDESGSMAGIKPKSVNKTEPS